MAQRINCKLFGIHCNVRKECLTAFCNMAAGMTQEEAYAEIIMPCEGLEPIGF